MIVTVGRFSCCIMNYTDTVYQSDHSSKSIDKLLILMKVLLEFNTLLTTVVLRLTV